MTATARTGPAGPQGPEGPPGADGAQGPQGPQGPLGPVGPGGPAGPQGSQGPEGDTGPQGPAGADGADGRTFDFRGVWDNSTAYVADDVVQHEGSSWIALGPNTNDPPGTGSIVWDELALRGAPGPQGIQGPQGVQGLQGIQGPQGVQGAPGEDGPQGPQGIQGTPGPDNVLVSKSVETVGAGDSGKGLLYDHGSGSWTKTDLATQAELAAHETDTTGVHGIADTSLLITAADRDADLAIWRLSGDWIFHPISLGVAAGNTFYVTGISTLTLPAAASIARHLDPSRWALPGKTTQIRLRAQIQNNAVDPPDDWKLRLFRVATRGGASGAAPNIQTVDASPLIDKAVGALSASQVLSLVSDPITYPAADWYVLGLYAPTGTPTGYSGFLALAVEARHI